MDNDSFSNAVHDLIGHDLIGQHPYEDSESEGMPAPVSPDALGSPAQQRNRADVEMNNHDNNIDPESNRDAQVELETVNDSSLSDHAIPNLSTSHISRDQPAVNNNRRARVEDDEDADRDRRHPSQRVGSSANAMSSAGPSTSVSSFQVPRTAQTPVFRLQGQAPIFSRTVVEEDMPVRDRFRFFQHLMSNNNNNDNNDTGNNNSDSSAEGPIPGLVPAPQPPPNGDRPHNQPHGRFEAFSITLDIGLGPPIPVGGGVQPSEGQPTFNAADPNLNANPNTQNLDNFSTSIVDFMARLGYAEERAEGTTTAGGNQVPGNTPGIFNLGNIAGFGLGFNLDGSGFAEKEDPERARKLVDGLEEVPVGLVRRLERVGGTGGGMGEDETKGGDGGCAICWDKLLGTEENQHDKWEQKRTSETSVEGPRAKIVSLPCAHVFHAECLIPWFSRPRQTTCPTCRFNIDPENLTYVSWRRRMRERRERERAEARARGDPEDTVENEASQNPSGTGAAAAAASVSEQLHNLLSSLQSQAVPPTPDAPVANVHPIATPRSQSQPPASSSPSSSSPGSSAHPMTQVPSQEAANDWDAIPGLEDVSDSDEDEGEDDEEEDEEHEDENEEGEAQEADEIQAPPLLSHTNEPPIPSAPGPQEQGQVPQQARQNDPLAPRTIQTAHGLITFIPVPFNFPFPSGGNGVGVGVQAGGNAANANAQVPPPAGQGQVDVNANANTPGLPQGHPGFPNLQFGVPFTMPEFGVQRGGPGPGNTDANANTNLNPALPANPFVNGPHVATITHTEEQWMQHLRSQGLTADQAENIRRLTMGSQADRLRGVDLDLEDDMMDIDEGMGVVVDLTMDQGVDGGIRMTGDPAAQGGQGRQDFDHVFNFLNHAARQAHEQSQTATQPQGQAPQGGTTAGITGDQSAQQPQQQPQPPPQTQQQQGQGVPVDNRTVNEFFSHMLSNMRGAQQTAQQAQQAQRQDAQPQPQAQAQPPPQANQEAAANPNTANTNDNGRRRQAHFTFGNVTFGPFAPLFPLPLGTPGNRDRGAGQERVKKAWTLPPAPGPTLRERIERRERDAGFRCYEVSCGVGPSDDYPAVNDETIAAGLRQLMIMSKNHGHDGKPGVCMHTFHPGCLVSAERVALGGADVSTIGSGDVEVSCPVCRSAGCVTRKEWEEGILALS